MARPQIQFFQTGGYAPDAGDKLTITATYDNPSRSVLREGAMGIVVGYFVPKDDAPLAALRHPAKTAPHDMATMPHDH